MQFKNLYFQLQDLKTSFVELQTEFQFQVKSLRSELEEEKQARLKLEAEVIVLIKNIEPNTITFLSSGQSFEKTDPEAVNCSRAFDKHLLHFIKSLYIAFTKFVLLKINS